MAGRVESRVPRRLATLLYYSMIISTNLLYGIRSYLLCKISDSICIVVSEFPRFREMILTLRRKVTEKKVVLLLACRVEKLVSEPIKAKRFPGTLLSNEKNTVIFLGIS